MNKFKKLAVLAIALVAAAAAAQTAVVIRSGSSTQLLTVNADGSLNVATSASASVSTPTKTETTLAADADSCTTPDDADCTVILASIEVVSFKNIAITIHNDGANTLSDVIVEFSPDGTTWETWDNTTFATLLTTDGLDMRSMQISGNSRRYLRIEGRSLAGTTTDVWLTMSR